MFRRNDEEDVNGNGEVMMRKIILSILVSGLFMFGMVSSVNAVTLVMHPAATTQLAGISEIDINGTLWDATFYNSWSVTPNKEAYGGFALEASQALASVFSTYQPLSSFKLKPQTIWGIETVGSGSLFTPSTAFFVNSFPDYWLKSGSTYNVGGTGTIGSLSGQGLDQEASIAFVQWSLSPTVVPVPAAVWLFGSGLIGLIGMARRKA